MKISRKVRRLFSIYNLAIILCIIAIVVSLIIILKPKSSKKVTADGVEIVQAKIGSDEQISEKEAKKIAVKQFKKIGESNIDENNLEILQIQRKGTEYYYVASKENTLEIKIAGGTITRVNSVVVE